MTPKKGAEDGLRELLAIGDGCRRIAPRPLWRLRPLIEIGEEDSLRREPSAGHSEGESCRASDGGGHLMEKAWLGVDAGKESHWAHMLDVSGTVVLSRKVENEEADLSKLIDDALLVAEELVWAVDQPGGSAALLLALLWERDQKVLYVPGLTVDRARDAYRGESKTDARDAHVIADQARMRPDLGELEPGEKEIAELQLLLARRRDLITDQSRSVTRLRETLESLFPALERALDLNSKGPFRPSSLIIRLQPSSEEPATSASPLT